MVNATFSPARFAAIEQFQHESWLAQVKSLFSRLTANNNRLDSFSACLPGLLPERHYLGVQEICLAQVTGSVGRSTDFDRSFRPLKAHLRDRWVNLYLLLQSGAWPPVRVYKVGEQYFVSDGHHRVSVAHSIGMRAIQAEVWEYTRKAA